MPACLVEGKPRAIAATSRTSESWSGRTPCPLKKVGVTPKLEFFRVPINHGPYGPKFLVSRPIQSQPGKP
jgi:hypothetical protein